MGRQKNMVLQRAGVIREIAFEDGEAGLERYIKSIHAECEVLLKQRIPDGRLGVLIIAKYNNTPLWNEPQDYDIIY